MNEGCERKRKVKDNTKAFGQAAGRMELPFSEVREIMARMIELRCSIWDLLSCSHLLNSQREMLEMKLEFKGEGLEKDKFESHLSIKPGTE